MINILSGLDSTAAALNAERLRMDVVGQNIANAQITKGLDGLPYQRERVVFETALAAAQSGQVGGSGLAQGPVARIVKDSEPPLLVYRPGHPEADANGMVAMPNINIHEEMVDMMVASRSFEANLAVIKTSRAMAMQTLSIGKR